MRFTLTGGHHEDGAVRDNASARWSVIAVIRGGTTALIESFIYQGYCQRRWFEQWLERLCQALPTKTHYLVLDNASFYKGGQIEPLLSVTGMS